jgi:ribosomal protein L7/L12
MSYIDQEIRNLIDQGRKIEAIKKVMAHTGKGLKEAKDYVDSLGKSDPPEMVSLGISSETLEFEVRELVNRGRRVEAVRKVRKLTGMDLKAAKEFVDSL